MTNPINKALAKAREDIDSLTGILESLSQYRDKATAEIAEYLRMESGAVLDVDAIRATVSRPYTVLPINEHEAWLIHWRGVKMPIFGWVIAQEPAFIKSKVSRSMDLLTPMPAWIKDEMGWRPPDHKAVIDGTRTGIKITEGEESTFKRKYGQHLGNRQADGSYKIKGGDAWIKLVASLVRDGILPYIPQPVDSSNWKNKVQYEKRLADLISKKQGQAGDPYIDRAVDEFHDKGAVLINYPPGSGKTLATCAILHHFVGKVLILADSTILIDQWRDRVRELAPNTESKVVFSTYQGAAKYIDQDWDLIIPDEAQRLPANTFSRLAFARTKYRLGLTGTAWREDDRQYLIVALSGFPVAIRWASLVASGALRRPRITVATVANEGAKPAYVKSLITKRKGRAVIFCDWLEQGQELADYLKVPFIHGGTAHKLERVKESDVCVVSRIGDRGVSLPDLRLVIEVAGAGAAREQFAQRVGRLLHGEFSGEFVTVFTPEEAAKYRGRVFGVEAELAGEVDIEFINIGEVKETVINKAKRSPRPIPKKSESPLTTSLAREVDQIAAALAIPSVWAKVQAAQKTVDSRAAAYVPKVIRFCWDAPLSVQDIMDGLGLSGERTAQRIKAACVAAQRAGLMIAAEGGRYRANESEIKRLKVLSNLKGK